MQDFHFLRAFPGIVWRTITIRVIPLTTTTLRQEDSYVSDTDLYPNCMLKGEKLIELDQNVRLEGTFFGTED